MVDQTQYDDMIKPWNSRCPIPIWRGSAWMNSKGGNNDNDSLPWYVNSTSNSIQMTEAHEITWFALEEDDKFISPNHGKNYWTWI